MVPSFGKDHEGSTRVKHQGKGECECVSYAQSYVDQTDAYNARVVGPAYRGREANNDRSRLPFRPRRALKWRFYRCVIAVLLREWDHL
jgi:hypothetical protein